MNWGLRLWAWMHGLGGKHRGRKENSQLQSPEVIPDDVPLDRTVAPFDFEGGKRVPGTGRVLGDDE
jgi:hypothetical protein